MEYNIIPFERVNDFSFGKTQAEIKKLDGPPFKIEIDNIMKEIRESRKGITLTYINKKLSDIIISKNVKAIYKNIDLFNDRDAISKLSAFDSIVEGRNKYILFKKVGICIGGFTKGKIPEDKLIIAFAKDRLDFYEIFINM